MTPARWLEERRSDVPPRLAARLEAALADAGDRGGDTAADCIDAGERLLRDLLRRESSGRDVALDLLTVDALATYAFEAAAAAPGTLRPRAAAAAARFAAAAND
jgi:hypothetical protein